MSRQAPHNSTGPFTGDTYSTLPKRPIGLHQAYLKMLYYYIMDARVSYLSHLEWSLCQRVHDADRLQIIIACLQRIF